MIRIVPGVDRNARVAEEVRVIRDRYGTSVARHGHDVAVHVEHLPAGIVRIVRLGRADVHTRGVDGGMPRNISDAIFSNWFGYYGHIDETWFAVSP